MDRSAGNSLISEISAQIIGLAININQVHSLTFTKFYRPELETVVSDWFFSQLSVKRSGEVELDK